MKQKLLFISHASEDRDVASHVVSFLESKGHLCWIAFRDILPAADWAESIIDGIDSSAGMVLLLSRQSNESQQVRREVERAVDKGIIIYPLLLESIVLSKWMQYYISAHQWNDASDVSLGSRLEELSAAVSANQSASRPDFAALSSLLADDLANLSAELDASGSGSERLLPGERREVSVLHVVADLSRRDASPSVRIAVNQTVVNMVERYVRFYGGYLERLSLNSYRCVFGLEQVQEDDSRRALSCGVCLCSGFGELNSVLQKKSLELDFGLGIALGMIEVDDSGKGVSQYRGEALHVARELAEVTSGSLLLSGTLPHSVRDQYSWEEYSEGVYRITDAGMDLPGSRVFSFQSPFVGRENELARLNSLLSRQASGTGKNSQGGAKHLLMGVKGEAGIGKSRLVHEFVTACCADVTVLRGQTLSFAQPSYWLWTTVLRNALGIESGSSVDYGEFLSRLSRFASHGVLTGSAPFLAELLSIKSGDSRLDELNDRGIALETGIAFSKLLQALCGTGKLLVVLEDLHWMDESDGKVLKFVLENCVTENPIVFLLVHRPEREDGAVVSFEAISTNAVPGELSVAEIDEKASVALVKLLLESISSEGSGVTDPEAEKFLLDRSKGNPFFLEELVFDMVESGLLSEVEGEWRFHTSTGDIFVPDSITGLIQSRLERLPESWKGVLQNSSVLGMEFQLKLYWKLLNKLYLGRCHHDVFDGLEQKQMLISEMNAFEKKYLFRHILVHDTAYASILAENLKKLHKAAAESIEEMYPNERERVSGILMHHYDMAQDRIRAIEWGFKAMCQYSGKELLKISLRVETLLEDEYSGDELQEKIFKMLSYREQALEVLGEREKQQLTINRMVGIAESRESDYLMAIAVKKRGVLAMFTGRLQDAISDLEMALELVRKVEDISFEGIVLGNLGGLCMHQGRMKEAEGYLERALEIHREVGDLRSEGVITMNMGILEKARGRMDEARTLYDNAIAIARKIGDRRTVADVLGNMGTLLWTMGLLDEAEKYQKDSLAIQREIGNRRSEAVTCVNLGILCMNQERYEEASEYYERGLGVARSLGATMLEGSLLGNMGVLYAEQGLDDKAGEYYEMSLAIHQKLGNKKDEAIVLSNLGGIQYRLGNMAEALNYYNESMRINSETGNEAENGAVYANLGCVFFHGGDIEEAYSCYMKSTEIATEMKQGIQNYQSIKDLRLNLLASGYSHEELSWPDHWEPYRESAPSPEESS